MPAEQRRDLVVLIGAAMATAGTAVVPLGPDLSVSGQYVIATMVFAAVLWVTGALPLPVTALLVPVLLAGFGVYSGLEEALLGFADPVVFLLLAGFALAEALSAHGIDRRIALRILVRVGTSPRRLVLAVMLATALLSMMISNTATTAMMIPIAIGLVGQVAEISAEEDVAGASNFQVSMLLGTAYAASLGGVGSLIGTPPNVIVVGQLRELVGVQISFVEWFAVGLPMVIVTLPIAWYLLVRIYPPEFEDVGKARKQARAELANAGSLDAAERRVVAIFAVTASLWLLGGLDFLFRGWLPSAWYTTLFGGSGTTLFGTTGHQGVLYFVIVGLLAIPALVVSGTMEWDDLAGIDWGTLILLGGGISLANALVDTNATTWLADVTLGSLTGTPILMVLVAIIGMTVVVGELASNTAMAAILAPLLVSVGPAYSTVMGTTDTMASVFLALVGAVAASYGFALPVATPPNAIAFGAGYITRSHMLRVGVVLDVVVILLSAGVLWLLLRFVWPVVIG